MWSLRILDQETGLGLNCCNFGKLFKPSHVFLISEVRVIIQ